MYVYDIYNGSKIINTIVAEEQFINEYCAKYKYTFKKKEQKNNILYTPIEQLQQENKLLKAQLKVQTERSDFIEDCIAEMAGVVYNTEETST